MVNKKFVSASITHFLEWSLRGYSFVYEKISKCFLSTNDTACLYTEIPNEICILSQMLRI